MVSDEILNAPVSSAEAEVVARRYMGSLGERATLTIGSVAEDLGMKPLLVARAISEERRGEDLELVAAIKRNDFLIARVGTARLSPEVVAGDRRLFDKFWRNNDPLGVYRPGDMWYVDEHLPWMPYFPFLILVPAAVLALVPLVGFVLRLFSSR